MSCCRDGYDPSIGRCCSCPTGRDRAARLWRSFERERKWQAAKERMRQEALTGPDFSHVLKRVPKVRWYGF